MSRVLIIGCGGVATVAINKCCQNSEVFTEICIASRTKSKCDALKDKLQPDTKTVITTAKVDADNAATSEKEDGDIEGPFTIALAAAKTENDTSSQVVVAGSMELFTDSTDQIVSGSNVSMFTDIMTNLTSGEDDNTSVIPVKDYKMSTITITSISTIIGGLAASIFIPVVLIIIGVVIWAVRRKK